MRQCSMLCATAVGAAIAAVPAASAPVAADSPVYVIGTVGPNLLDTTPVPIRAQRFTGSWAKAIQDSSGLHALQRMVAPARSLSPVQQIAYVQSRVHTNIRWISDATEWGRHDYWASASETLARGAGDMEDRAIVKLHALRALGFSAGDLFLTMGRDQVGGPVTVLVVRSRGRFLVLDDTGGAPFPIETRRKEFRPLLSFGSTGVWAHTTPAAARPIATAAASSLAKR